MCEIFSESGKSQAFIPCQKYMELAKKCELLDMFANDALLNEYKKEIEAGKILQEENEKLKKRIELLERISESKSAGLAIFEKQNVELAEKLYGKKSTEDLEGE